MASGTVGYTDTRGNKDYSSIIANQIGRRLKEASNMASEERAFAADRAEAGGTSLEEAGIGKGYFFGRALGSRFGGDRIARTRGRMGASGPGTNPAASYKQRFRGGFDYNVTNQVENITDTAPLSNAVVQGLRGVQGGLVQVAAAISRQDSTMGGLANTQADMAKAIMFNGYLFQMFANQQKAERGRASARREERSIEGGGGFGGTGIGGQGFGGAGGGRGMINITPSGTGASRGGGSGANTGGDVAGSLASLGTSQLLGKKTKTLSAFRKTKQFVGSSFDAATPLASKSSKTMAQILAGNVDTIALNTGRRLGAAPNAIRAITNLMQNTVPFLKNSKTLANATGVGNTILMARNILGPGATDSSVLMLSNALGIGAGGRNAGVLLEASTNFAAASDAMAKGRGAANMMDTMYGIGRMSADDQLRMIGKYGDDAERLMGLGFADDKSRLVGQISKKFPGVKFTDPLQAIAVTEIANRVDKGMEVVEAIDDVRKFYGPGIDNAIASASKLIPEKTKLAGALAKATGKTAGKGILKSALKKIPVIAGVMGVIFGIQRALEGDLFGAGLEITSGMLGATGVGSSVGLAIDGYLLGRDLGALPMRTGGRMSGFAANSLLSVNGVPLASFNEPGNPESIVVERDNEDKFVDMGIGLVEGFKKSKTDYIALQGEGVGKGFSDLEGGGFFQNLFGNNGNPFNFFNNNQQTNNNQIPLSLMKPNTDLANGISNWFWKGYSPAEDTMSVKDLMIDDWKQRGKFGKAGKLGGWDFTRGFRPGVPAEEGGFMSGPTPAGRQAVKRTLGFLSSFRGGALATLASLVANEFINPQPLADGTMDAYLKQLGTNNTQNLQNVSEAGSVVTQPTIINNYYNGANGQPATESGDETLGQGFNMDLDKFITNYSIASK